MSLFIVGFYLFPQLTWISNTNELVEQSKIIICDLQGKQLKSVSLQTNGENQIEIDKTDLYSGIFIYNLVVGNKIIDSKRMIVN
ncbi:MAG: T9SS type A sorting domain-containing protein [Bacteroidales bacterium]|nr:T9SS type A sorting domain-containing protein [Bacteroidales bacterium]